MGRETKKTALNSLSARLGRLPIMRLSLLVSLVFHATVLAGLHRAFPVSWTETLRTYHVELFRPPIDQDREERALQGADLAGPRPNEPPKETVTEDTISLDTQDERYSSYVKIIKERLLRCWVYPAEARDRLIEGTVLVVFTLTREGRLTETRILDPSPHFILNEEARRAIREAAPFPPFPGSVTVTRLNIKASFAYQLAAGK